MAKKMQQYKKNSIYNLKGQRIANSNRLINKPKKIFDSFPKTRYMVRMFIFDFFITLGLITTPIDLLVGLMATNTAQHIVNIFSLSVPLFTIFQFLTPIILAISLGFAIKNAMATHAKLKKYTEQENELHQRVLSIPRSTSKQEFKTLLKELKEIKRKQQESQVKSYSYLWSLNKYSGVIAAGVISSSSFILSIAGLIGLNVITTVPIIGPLSPIVLTGVLIAIWSVMCVCHKYYEEKLNGPKKEIKKLSDKVEFFNKIESNNTHRTKVSQHKQVLRCLKVLSVIYKTAGGDIQSKRSDAKHKPQAVLDASIAPKTPAKCHP